MSGGGYLWYYLHGLWVPLSCLEETASHLGKSSLLCDNELLPTDHSCLNAAAEPLQVSGLWDISRSCQLRSQSACVFPFYFRTTMCTNIDTCSIYSEDLKITDTSKESRLNVSYENIIIWSWKQGQRKPHIKNCHNVRSANVPIRI